MTKTPEELVSYAVERTHDDSFRQSVVQLEFERRVAIAQIETANATKLSAQRMLWSVIALVVTGIVSALFQYLGTRILQSKGFCPRQTGLTRTRPLPCSGA